MAEQAVNSVILAMTGELTSRVFSGLIQMYGKEEATDKKLQRLEMLLIKIHSVVEASEKRIIKNSRLLWWRDKLKEAASQGDNVLANFQQQAQDAQASSNTNNGSQQQGEAVSSSVSAPTTDVGAASFTKNSLSDMVQGICNVTNMLFCTVDDEMEKLNRTLGREALTGHR
uniref:Uncharacterized protein n=1 Tax=Avena sativa TaxID=4498 RepID=A0ACD6A2G0_AVESA